MLTSGIDGCEPGASGECRDINHEEPHNRVVITEEVDSPDARGASESAFARRHPFFSYLFGAMSRGSYLFGCLAWTCLRPCSSTRGSPGWTPSCCRRSSRPSSCSRTVSGDSTGDFGLVQEGSASSRIVGRGGELAAWRVVEQAS